MDQRRKQNNVSVGGYDKLEVWCMRINYLLIMRDPGPADAMPVKAADKIPGWWKLLWLVAIFMLLSASFSAISIGARPAPANEARTERPAGN